MYIDIHTHTAYHAPDAKLLVNVFPGTAIPAEGWISAGLHPWHILDDWPVKVSQVADLALHEKRVLAIGETGLDKAIKVPFEQQKAVFEKHMELALAVNKPMVIHCVKSYSEMLSYRKKASGRAPWIFHWFSSTEEMALELIRKECFLSFGHKLFEPESKALAVFRELPLEHVFFETDDAGYSIAEIYDQAAAIRQIPVPELKNRIMDNFTRCFKLR